MLLPVAIPPVSPTILMSVTVLVAALSHARTMVCKRLSSCRTAYHAQVGLQTSEGIAKLLVALHGCTPSKKVELYK